MRTTYKVLAYAIAAEVVVQAAVMIWAISGLGLWVEDGGVFDKSVLESEANPFSEATGFMIHGINGTMVIPVLALVGRANVGKSTLFNRLTGSDVTADARMFATLDPTVRHITLPSNRRVLLSDTVGFIRNLPTTLVQAFRATLEEVVEAELLIHVVDVAGPHAPEDTAHVFRVLGEIGAQETPQILVMNKVDLLPERDVDIDATAQRLLAEVEAPRPSTAVALSAREGEGLNRLLDAIDRMLTLDPVERATFKIPAGDGAELNFLHERARVISKHYSGEYCEVVADAPESVRRRLKPFLANTPAD